jgi:hypothetical protein
MGQEGVDVMDIRCAKCGAPARIVSTGYGSDPGPGVEDVEQVEALGALIECDNGHSYTDMRIEQTRKGEAETP